MNKIIIRKIITAAIFVTVIIIVAITYFIIKNKEGKGETCNLGTTIVKDNYKLTFYNDYGTNKKKDVVYLVVVVTNTTDTDLEFKFSNLFYVNNKGQRIKIDSTKETIKANDIYELVTWCTYSNYTDATKYKLHFTINGDSYNLYNYAETHTS